MATYSSTTFGGISGRHGTAVASVGKTGNVLKVYKAPSNPKTERQITQRTKFSFSTNSMASMRELFKYTFRHKGGYNYGLSLAMKGAVAGESPNFTVDFSKLKVAEGSVYGAGVTTTKQENKELKLEWTTANIYEKGSGAKSADMVYVVFFNEEVKEACLYDGVALRKEGTTTVTIPELWSGKTHGWMYFGRADESLESNSIYLGEMEY